MDNITKLKTPNNKLRSLGLRRSTLKIIGTKTPQSKFLETQSGSQDSSPLTSRQPTTVSSDCKQNCPSLPLSQGARENYKKKKLEFAANQSLLNLKSPSDLRQEVAKNEKLLQTHTKHKEKVKELNNIIAIWTEAFKDSLEELSSKIEPRMETEDLIVRLGIPPDMIDKT